MKILLFLSMLALCACNHTEVSSNDGFPVNLRHVANGSTRKASIKASKPENATSTILELHVFDGEKPDEGEFWVNGHRVGKLFPQNTPDEESSWVKVSTSAKLWKSGDNDVVFKKLDSWGFQILDARVSFQTEQADEPKPEPKPDLDPKPLPNTALTTQGRFLQAADQPFIFNYFTMWGLRSLSDSEIDYLFERLSAMGFNTVGFVAWSNDYGQTSRCQTDPEHPLYTKLDYIVSQAKIYGLRLQMVHGWGAQTPKYESKDRAVECIRFIGQRYASEPHILHSITNEYNEIDEDSYLDWFDAMGKALDEVTDQLITIHPVGSAGRINSSRDKFGNKDWLDFNTSQTFKQFDKSDDIVYQDWQEPKPAFAGEMKYEGEDADAQRVREQCLISFFSGSQGCSYGNIGWAGNRDKKDWRAALDWEAANDMKHLYQLFMSRSREHYKRIPGQEIAFVLGKTNFDTCYARNSCMAFAPKGGELSVNLDVLAGNTARIWRFDTRSGTATNLGDYASTGQETFSLSPFDILVVDNADIAWEAP